MFDLNVHDFLLTEFDAFHCVEIGPITEEGEYDDEYGGDEESNKWQMRLDFVGSDRHYVKAVGFNNRRDELAGLLIIYSKCSSSAHKTHFSSK